MRTALLSLLLLASSTAAAQGPGPGRALPPFVAAEGQAFVSVAPDRAVVAFGVQRQDATAQKAQAGVNEAMQRILTAVKRLGVPESRIATARLDLFPVFSQQRPDEPGREPRVVGFRAANSVRVTLDLEAKGPAIGAVLDAALGAGANSIEGIDFQLADDTEPRARALRAAAENARAKAGAIADALGARLGELREAAEGGVDVGPMQPMMRMEMRAMSAPTSVQPGEIRVDASVRVRYAIEPKAGR
ncbi:MAG TPA: SIMPL domain-containing protein [Vulgatibacter sp.]|nr:SIMPL domain-containing protein [Vulgatibacter sp.]